MTRIICPFCKRDLWIEEDEDLTECPFCGKRLSETADPSQSKEQAHSEEVDYKELYLKEKEKNDKHKSDAIGNAFGELAWELIVGFFGTLILLVSIGACNKV